MHSKTYTVCKEMETGVSLRRNVGAPLYHQWRNRKNFWDEPEFKKEKRKLKSQISREGREIEREEFVAFRKLFKKGRILIGEFSIHEEGCKDG